MRIQMRINVSGRRECGMSKPKLYLLHADILPDKQAGTAVPEIVEANLPQAVLLQKLSELRGDIVWSKNFCYGTLDR